MLRSYSSVALSYSHLSSFWRRLGNAREEEKKRQTNSHVVCILYYSLFYLTRVAYFIILFKGWRANAAFVDRHLLRRETRAFSRVFIPPPSCLSCVCLFVVEGRREKDSDGDDIGASIVATPTTKELALEEKRVWSESSSLFEQSDDDVWEDAVFACI